MKLRAKIRTNPSQYHQQGSAMILSIMVMMGLGMIALNSLQQQLSAGLALTSHQHRYAIAWENAASSLSWGVSEPWKLTAQTKWQCQTLTVGIMTAGSGRTCVRPSLREDVFVVRGEGRSSEEGEPVILYQQVSAQKQADGLLIFSPLRQGWLDFCPLADELFCDD